MPGTSTKGGEIQKNVLPAPWIHNLMDAGMCQTGENISKYLKKILTYAYDPKISQTRPPPPK